MPVMPSRTPPARHAPRVAAANAARAEIALPGVWCRVAARTVAHGFMSVTGLSEPKAIVNAETLRIHAVVTAPQRVEIGLHAGEDAPCAEPARLVVGDHLEVFESMPAARHRRCPEVVDDSLERGHDGGGRGVADDVESRGDACFGAGVQVSRDRVGVEVGVAAAVGRVGIRLVQPCGV